MNFEARARRAHERGEPMRALFLLVEGFKRQDGSLDALLWMLELFATHNRAVGLESDMIAILSSVDDSSKHLTRLIVQLEQHEHQHLIDALLAEALSVGLMPAPVEDVFDTLPPKREHDGVFMEVEVLDIVDEAHDEALETFDEPFDEDEFDQTKWSTGRQARVTFDSPRSALDDQAQNLDDEHTPGAAGVDEVLAPTPEVEFQPKAHAASPKRVGRKRAWLVVTTLVVAALVTWAWVDRRAGVDVLDHQMERFDVLNPEPFERTLAQSSKRWGLSSAQVDDRRSFVYALMALETQREPLSARPEGDSAWSMAAAVLFDIHAKSLEHAVTTSTTLNHKWPDQLPALWAAARLAQARGKNKEAATLYERLQDTHPQFLFGMMARMRMAVERGDRLQWDVAQRQLLAFDDTHPYATVTSKALPDAKTFLTTSLPYARTAPKRLTSMDHFLEARHHYLNAYDAWRRHDGASAKMHINKARTLSPQWVDVAMLDVVIEATHGSIDDATARAFKLAQRGGLDASARLMFMAVVPYVLIEAGQRQAALTLSFDPGGDASHHDWLKTASKADRAYYESKRPVPLALQPGQWKPYDALVAVAFEARAHLLLESGYGTMALSTLKEMEQAQVMNRRGRLLRLWALIRLNKRHNHRAALKALGEGADRELGVTALGLLDNKSEEPLAALQKHPIGPLLDTPFGVRTYIRALLSAKKIKEAQALMKSHPWSPTWMWSTRGLRLRVNTKLAKEDAQQTQDKLIESMMTNDAQHLSQMVDAAVVLMWRGRINRAQSLARKVIARQPTHPEANWVMALTYRHLRQYSKSQRYMLKASGISSDQPVSSRQVASMYMELGRYAEARQLFYKAFLADRRDVVALGGMANAFLKYDVQRGQHEFARFYQGFVNKTRFRAQAGEVSKWLGVLHGSREGKPEGLVYLQRALTELGPRADVLIEHGRYYRALGKHKIARGHFISALQADSTSANAHLGLARVALSLKQMQQARDHLRKFLELQPFGPESKWATKTLQRTKSL